MTDNLNGPVCTCGESLDTYHGITVCPHCDQACTVDDCAYCRAYSCKTNVRVARERYFEGRQGK